MNLLKDESVLLTLTPLRLFRRIIPVRLACVKTPRTRSLRATVKLITNNFRKIHIYRGLSVRINLIKYTVHTNYPLSDFSL